MLLNEHGDTLGKTDFMGNEKPYRWETFTYNAKGQRTQEISHYYNDPDDYYETIYTYDSIGNRIHDQTIRHDDNQVETIWENKYTYSNGRLVTWQDYDGKILTRAESYEYDAQGFLIRKTECYDSCKRTFTYIYTRDAHGRPLKMERINPKDKSQTRYPEETWEYTWW